MINWENFLAYWDTCLISYNFVFNGELDHFSLSEEECAKAFAIFNARWYASKQLSCEFSPVTKWKSAICGLFERNRCPRGKNCNFLHVYQNPRNEFSHRDELSPGRTPHNGRWSERSDRDWNREQRNRHRDMDRGRSREGDARYEAKHRKYRERDKSKERDHSRHRHHRRGEFYRKKERSKTRDTSSDEDSQSEKEEKQLHQRLSPDVNENVETLIEIEEERHSHGSKENKKEKNRKRKHHSSHKRRHRHKNKKKHKYHSEQKKKKHRSRSSDSSSSDSDSD